MSRLLIVCGPQAQARLATLLEHFPDTTGLDEYHSQQLAIAVGGGGVIEVNGVVLALEGFVTHRTERGDCLLKALIIDFIKNGEACVKQWRGSFRLLISDNGVTRIYSDQLASRAFFFTDNGFETLYCSHTAPLLAAIKTRTIDGANLLQFLHAGRFFAGASLFTELRQLSPGSVHRLNGIGDQRLQIFTWYEFRLENLDLHADAILPELKARLDSAILQHWQRADGPVLLLSGGVDSRYILNTLAELLPKDELGQLHTCLWGEPNVEPGSDAAWAAREAARHNLPFSFYPIEARIEGLFNTLFTTQSGMTSHVISHTDDYVWSRHLALQGRQALLRGDECFGPNGAEVNSREAALKRVGLGCFSDDDVSLNRAFNGQTEDWQGLHAQHIVSLSQVADEPNDVRDILYCRERLPSLNAHLNSQRAPFVENFNPLLDPDILDLIGQLPRHLRTDKRILRQCFQRYYPTEGFATSGNAFNWQRLWLQPGLAEFIQDKLARLPEPFNSAYWHQVGQLLSANNHQAAKMERASQHRAIQMACRAIVLGHWLRP